MSIYTVFGKALLPLVYEFGNDGHSTLFANWRAYQPCIDWQETICPGLSARFFSESVERNAVDIARGAYSSSVDYIGPGSAYSVIKSYMSEHWQEYTQQRFETLKQVRQIQSEEINVHGVELYAAYEESAQGVKKLLRAVLDNTMKSLGYNFKAIAIGKFKCSGYFKPLGAGWMFGFMAYWPDFAPRKKGPEVRRPYPVDIQMLHYTPTMLAFNADTGLVISYRFETLFNTEIIPFQTMYSHCWTLADLELSAKFHLYLFSLIESGMCKTLGEVISTLGE